MHDRAVKPTGATKSAAAVASEIMILLNIDLRIAQIRPRVEERVHSLPPPSYAHAPAFLVRYSAHWSPHPEAGPTLSAETAPNAFGATVAGFHLHLSRHFARNRVIICS